MYGIYRSLDYGVTWAISFSQVIDVFDFCPFFAISTHNSGEVIYAGNNYIHQSSDYGKTWSLSFNNSQYWIGIAINSVGDIAYAVPELGFIYKFTPDSISTESPSISPTAPPTIIPTSLLTNSPTSSSLSISTSSKSVLSIGAIVGIAVGGAALIIIGIIVGYIIFTNYHSKKHTSVEKSNQMVITVHTQQL